MHIKVASLDSWNFEVQPTSLVKVAHGGMGAQDTRDFLKRASVDFLDQIKGMDLHPGEIPVHLLAIGSTEGYGPNRNGDGFKEATCKEWHDTFVKNAYNYKNHKNKDPKASYGRIKASAYNNNMRRIELLLTFNSTKEAAVHNDGLVAEDWVLNKLAKGEDVPFSMACKVAYDVCASCGNKAKHRGEYCTEDTCIGPRGEKRGGCKANLAKVAYDGHINHVDNPNSGFFDMSHLSTKPADRIAYGGVADYMAKAASGEILGGAALAEAWGLEGDYQLRLGNEQAVMRHMKLAFALAAVEDALVANPDRTAILCGSFVGHDEMPVGPLAEKSASVLGSLARHQIVLPVSTFLQWEKAAEYLPEVQQRLPGVFNRMIKSAKLTRLMETNAYEVSTELPLAAHRNWAQKYAADYSLNREAVQDRACRWALRGSHAPHFAKQANVAIVVDTAERLAWKYALLKIAMLDAMGDVSPSVLEMAVLQNYVS